MKKLVYLFCVIIFNSCSSAKVNDSWKSDKYENYKPKKVLIVGVSQNLTARKMFEETLKKEFDSRGVIAAESYDVFESSFKSTKQTEEEIEEQINSLTKNGYDAVLISIVKGVEEKTAYSIEDRRSRHYARRFRGDYYLYQDIYFEPKYYENYKVYTIESSLYNIDPDSEKALVWVASYDIVDPKRINKTVKNYIKIIIETMEKEGLINSMNE